MDDLEKSMYPLSRYWYNGGFRFYYAYGNTPPQDFLQNCKGEKHPSILVLGCGDIRSCFYSIWKNFDINGPVQFDGVYFVLNDNSAAVLARNILFLHLCLQMPKNDEDIKKWLSSTWAIWYCHELYPQHNKLLHDSLQTLCKYSSDWTSNSNLLYPMIKFSSVSTFNEVKRTWKMWLEHDIDVSSVKMMHLARQKEFQVRNWSQQCNDGAAGFVEDSTSIPFEHCHNSSKVDTGKKEFLAYTKTGSAYAEKVLGLDLPNRKTFINFTLYEREDGKYNLHYRSLPFSSYFHTVEFSAKQLLSSSSTATSKLYVANMCFKNLPFLANSVQQFSLWLQSCHKVLSSKGHANITFTFNCSHALNFCYELGEGIYPSPLRQFDLIYTSNLMDHLCPPNLILSGIPLLKENGLLFTATLYKAPFETIENLLTATFGFGCKLFPIIFGIRCINYEGGSYASPVTVQPHPITMKRTSFVYHEEILIWEKLSIRLPLVFPPGQRLSDVITKALLSSVITSVYPVLKPTLVSQMMTNLCVESAVKVIQVFMLNVCADFTPQFWQPLSDSMKHSIKPYLHSMQTQLFLHDIHMHISVDHEDCPFCLHVPLSNHIGLFAARLFLQQDFHTPKYMALVHKEEQDNAEYLCGEARKGGNVFIFDCVSPTTNPDEFLELYFYAPLKLIQDMYKVTIVSSIMGQVLTVSRSFSSNIPYLPTKLLSNLQITFASFQFFKAPCTAKRKGYVLESFGIISSHISDGDSSEVEIDLHSGMYAGSNKKFQTQRVSSSSIKLSFGNESCILNHLFPISYSGINIKLMRKTNKVILHNPRAFQPFEEEKPLFIVNTEKEFSLSPFALSKDAIVSLSGQQFTKLERDKMKTSDQNDSLLPPLIQVKKSFLHFFQTTDYFYNFVHPTKGVVGLVIINNRMFDYESRTPVVDLAFCFLEESFVNTVAPLWIQIMNELNQLVSSIDVNDSMFEQLKKVLYYFASRTNGNCTFLSDDKSRLNVLRKNGIQAYFERAVISLLLCDPDHYTQMIMNEIKKPDSNERVSTEKCDNCGNYFQSTKLCSNCRRAMYCSKLCQREHWKVHKKVCIKEKIVQGDKKEENKESSIVQDGKKNFNEEKTVKDANKEGRKETTVVQDGKKKVNEEENTVFQPFPLARYWCGGDFRFYYAIGNSAAQDFLENCTGIDTPDILLLGCGDIRSCFYTLWKNFDSTTFKTYERFQGVHFVLNDCSSPILARNIIFLHLCMGLPSGVKKRKEWLSAMWAIWYCHELYPQHQSTLNNSLKVLIQHSETLDRWMSSSNPLCHLIKFTSSAVLSEISKIWKNWYHVHDTKISIEQMQLLRQNELQKRGVINSLDTYALSISSVQTFINGECSTFLAGKQINARISEVKAYTQHGNCYAEKVLNLDTSPSSTSVNLTLFERSDGMYTLHYGSLPYSGYYHTVQFSPEALSSAGVQKSTIDALLVNSHYFNSLPSLANSVQQFTMWIQSASEILNRPANANVSFTFNNDHAVSLCQILERAGSKYDLIYTSNLMDHLGPPNMILPAIPILKPMGLLFTTTLIYKTFANTAAEYLNACFGFDCKFLPIILGIRCINVEGSNYANPVIIEPTPVDIGHMHQSKQQGRLLVWQKVLSPPLVISELPPLQVNNLTKALANSVKASAFTLLDSCGNSQAVLNNICIETAVHVLQTFMTNILEVDKNYHFWDPLSSVLCSEAKPFLHGLQTQCLLHNLHIHLTVDEGDCPICTNTSMEKHLGLFCANISLPMPYTTPHFMALIHQKTSSDAQYWCSESIDGKDVHIIDCIHGEENTKTLKLKFFAPLKFVAQNYKITIVLSQRTEAKNTILTAVPTTSLKSMLIDFIKYDFSYRHQPQQSHPETNEDFGKLKLHICDGDEANSEIALSDSAVEMLRYEKLSTKKISSDEFKLICGTLHFILKYKYPINYDSIKVKRFKSMNVIQITSPRDAHKFVEEQPIFIKTPDNQLSLLPKNVNDGIIECHTSMQKTREERNLSDSCNRDHAQMTPLMNVKETFMILFQCKEKIFQVNFPNNNNHALLIVNQCLFDYQHKAPALDLAFCIVEASNAEKVIMAWCSITDAQKNRTILADGAEYDLLRKSLLYFSKRTNGNCQTTITSNQYQVLFTHKIQQYFTRAVIFPLYCDPDQKGSHMMNYGFEKYSKMLKNTKAAAGFVQSCLPSAVGVSSPQVVDEVRPACVSCKTSSTKLFNCTRCRKVKYCGTVCQKKDWKVHKVHCK